MTPTKRLPQLAVGALAAVMLLAANAATTHAIFPPSIAACGTESETTGGGSTTTTISPVTGVTVGDDIIVILNTSAAVAGSISMTDNAVPPNVYVERANTARPLGIHTAIFDSIGVGAVPPTEIYITHGSAVSRNAICLRNSSGSSIAFSDTTTASGSSATTGSSDISGAPPDVLLVAGMGRQGPTTTWTPSDAGYTQVVAPIITSAPEVEVDAWWQIRTDACAPPCNLNGLLGGARQHVGQLVAYRWGGELAAETSELTGARVGSAARIQWTTLSESDVAGFRIYREGTAGGRVNITRKLLPARGDAFSGRAYSFLDRSAPSGGVRYWLEEVDSSGEASGIGSVFIAPFVRKGASGPNDPLVLPNEVIQYEGIDAGSQVASEEVGE